jgi:hypothetical protein
MQQRATSKRAELTRRVILACALVASLSPQLSAAQPQVPKQVHLVIDGNRLIASNIKLSRFDELQLAARERVRETEEGSAVILVATNQRMLAYGSTTGWRSINRVANEEVLSLSAEDYAGLIVTNQRLLNFNAETGVWAEYDRGAAR